MNPPTLMIERFDAAGMHERKDELLAVYAEVYHDQLTDPFFSEPRFWQRLEGYASRDGFTLVTGRLSGELIGYALGFTLAAGSGWWRGLQHDADPASIAETGHRTFALTEIMVRAPHRRRGYAHLLHDALLVGRREERATLLVLPDNTAAQAAYRSWGWRRTDGLRPFDDAPLYDAMLLDLPPTGGTNPTSP